MAERHEWDIDYPPPRRLREAVAFPQRRGWADPRVTRAVDIVWKAVWGLLGAVAAAGLAVVGIGALWLLSAALSGF